MQKNDKTKPQVGKGQQDPVELHDELKAEAGLPAPTWRERFRSVESVALDEAAKLAADPHSRQVRRALRRRIAKQEAHDAAEARRKRHRR